MADNKEFENTKEVAAEIGLEAQKELLHLREALEKGQENLDQIEGQAEENAIQRDPNIDTQDVVSNPEALLEKDATVEAGNSEENSDVAQDGGTDSNINEKKPEGKEEKTEKDAKKDGTDNKKSGKSNSEKQDSSVVNEENEKNSVDNKKEGNASVGRGEGEQSTAKQQIVADSLEKDSGNEEDLDLDDIKLDGIEEDTDKDFSLASNNKKEKEHRFVSREELLQRFKDPDYQYGEDEEEMGITMQEVLAWLENMFGRGKASLTSGNEDDALNQGPNTNDLDAGYTDEKNQMKILLGGIVAIIEAAIMNGDYDLLSKYEKDMGLMVESGGESVKSLFAPILDQISNVLTKMSEGIDCTSMGIDDSNFEGALTKFEMFGGALGSVVDKVSKQMEKAFVSRKSDDGRNNSDLPDKEKEEGKEKDDGIEL